MAVVKNVEPILRHNVKSVTLTLTAAEARALMAIAKVVLGDVGSPHEDVYSVGTALEEALGIYLPENDVEALLEERFRGLCFRRGVTSETLQDSFFAKL